MSRFRLEDLPRWIRDFGPLIFWLVLIYGLSDQSQLADIEDEITERVVYKLAHVLAYAVLAWLWWRVLAPQRQATWLVLPMAWVLSILYGISDEIHQLYVPGRSGRVADVLFNAAGALLTVLLLRRFERLRGFPETWPVVLGGRLFQ